jgi:ATP-dependent DNA helicase RecG
MIAKIFRELGYVEELGSGRINIQRYAPLYYSDYSVQVVNDEKFSFTIVYQNIENLNINKPNTEIQHAETLDSKISILINQAMKIVDANRTVNDENRTLNDENRTLNDENRTVNDENRTVNDENRTLKTELHNVIIVLLKNQGISRKEISALIKKGKTVTHQYLKILKDARIVEFIGADKTGGYYLTEEIKKLLS